ncbi:hypothetical protein WKW80_26740 [Variovorax humicola]|uniref:Uncharacterized protein n=1 Tax=Variovorax humicola TaxID=1769758 RepID=A0ABU8W6A2_9BURK
MANLWPWLAVAGLGAFHGLNPSSGWMLAAAWGMRSRNRTQALRALLPIAAGHAASVALVVAAVAFGVVMDRVVRQVLAGGLMLLAAGVHLSGRAPAAARGPAGHIGLALWSFMMSTAHGAGLMLVPALAPLCMGDGAARQGTALDSLWLALAAVGIHTVAMLAVTGLVASGVCRGFDALAAIAHGQRSQDLDARLPLVVHRFAQAGAQAVLKVRDRVLARQENVASRESPGPMDVRG